MINSINTLLDRKGEKYVNKLLDEENLTITEKLDTFRLLFEKKNDEIIFYKKDNNPINIIDRTLSDIYEEAILEIPLMVHDIEIPENYFFGVDYTPVERPLRIPYSELPKYILTDVTKRENGKIVENLSNSYVIGWADVMGMGKPPILFEGKLNEEQKNLLIAYDTKQYKGESLSFAKMIEKIFGGTCSGEDIIEGIVIKSGDKLAQIISYEFDLLNEAYEKKNESRDFYDIIIMDLTQFLNEYNIPVMEAEDKEQTYLNIICDIFNKYCVKQSVSENMDAKYLAPPQFGYHGSLNKKFIKNNETLEWIERGPIYEALFKVFLSSFRKTKKSYGLLTESIVSNFNSYVYLINNYINKFNNLEEVHRLLESRSENIVIDAIKRRKPSDVDNMRVIASIQKAFEPKIVDVIKGRNPCAVYVTTFEPFTNAQMTNVIRMNKMWNCPVVLFSVSNKFKVEGKEFHASDDTVRGQMQSLMNENNSLIPAFALLDSWNITEIFEYCRPNFEPIVIITDEGKKSEMTLQLFFEEEIMGGRLNVEDKFNIGELANEDKLSSIRALEDTNFSLYAELVPKPILNYWDKLKNEYRLWSGAIIKPIKD